MMKKITSPRSKPAVPARLEPNEPVKEAQSEERSAMIAAPHRRAIEMHTREFYGQRIEVRGASVPLGGIASLEKQAEELAKTIAGIEAQSKQLERRSQLARAADAAAMRHNYCEAKAEQAAQQESAFRSSIASVDENLQRMRFSLERLEAGASDELGRLASIHGAIEDLKFFGATHASRCKTCAANTKSADAVKSAASAALKTATADLAEIDKQIAALKPDDTTE